MSFAESFCIFLVTVSICSAATFDLKTDFSTSSNPNGVWSYRDGTNLLTASNVQGCLSLSSSTPGWTVGCPATLFSATSDQLDWLTGDIVTHTNPGNVINIRFTAPSSGIASISGNTWMMREVGRTNNWSILVNGSSVTSGSMTDHFYTRSSPMLFSSGTGGAGVLSGIALALGDTIELQYAPPGTGDFAGMNLAIELSNVPEPAAFWLVAPATLWFLRRRRM